METLNSETVYFLTSESDARDCLVTILKNVRIMCKNDFQKLQISRLCLCVCIITWWFLLDSSNTKATNRKELFFFFPPLWLVVFRVVRILCGRESWAAGDSHDAEVAKIHCVLLGQFVQMKDLAFTGLIKCFLSLWIPVHPFC